MPLEQGQIQVYTGNGKGKTTAALGLAFRACGKGLRVLMIQFMKGGGPYGEHDAAEKLAPLLTIIPTGRPGWVKRPVPDPEDVELAEKQQGHRCGLRIQGENGGARHPGCVDQRLFDHLKRRFQLCRYWTS